MQAIITAKMFSKLLIFKKIVKCLLYLAIFTRLTLEDEVLRLFFSKLGTESFLWFHRDVAADSYGPALRQQGNSLRSSIWVQHSRCPSTLPLQRSRDTTSPEMQSQTELFPVPQLE